MRILAVGDLIGESGVKKLKEILPKIKKEEKIDFVVTNGIDGKDGKDGQDYILTDEDKAEIESNIESNVKNYVDTYILGGEF